MSAFEHIEDYSSSDDESVSDDGDKYRDFSDDENEPSDIVSLSQEDKYKNFSDDANEPSDIVSLSQKDETQIIIRMRQIFDSEFCNYMNNNNIQVFMDYKDEYCINR